METVSEEARKTVAKIDRAHRPAQMVAPHAQMDAYFQACQAKADRQEEQRVSLIAGSSDPDRATSIWHDHLEGRPRGPGRLLKFASILFSLRLISRECYMAHLEETRSDPA